MASLEKRVVFQISNNSPQEHLGLSPKPISKWPSCCLATLIPAAKLSAYGMR